MRDQHEITQTPKKKTKRKRKHSQDPEAKRKETQKILQKTKVLLQNIAISDSN